MKQLPQNRYFLGFTFALILLQLNLPVGFYERRKTKPVRDLLVQQAPPELKDPSLELDRWLEGDALARVPSMLISKNLLACYNRPNSVFKFFLKHEQELKKAIGDQCLTSAQRQTFDGKSYDRSDLYDELQKLQKLRLNRPTDKLSGLKGSSLGQFDGMPTTEACPLMIRRLKAFQALVKFETQNAVPDFSKLWESFNSRFIQDRAKKHK